MLLYFWKASENKIFHFIYFCFFVSSPDFELLKLFIFAPPKCENCFKLVARVLRFERGKTKKKHNQNSQEVWLLIILRGKNAWLAKLYNRRVIKKKRKYHKILLIKTPS